MASDSRRRTYGFMLRLKRRWDKQYPEKNRVSKQNLRDNAARFKKELEMCVGSQKSQIEMEEDNFEQHQQVDNRNESKLTKD